MAHAVPSSPFAARDNDRYQKELLNHPKVLDIGMDDTSSNEQDQEETSPSKNAKKTKVTDQTKKKKKKNDGGNEKGVPPAKSNRAKRTEIDKLGPHLRSPKRKSGSDVAPAKEIKTNEEDSPKRKAGNDVTPAKEIKTNDEDSSDGSSSSDDSSPPPLPASTTVRKKLVPLKENRKIAPKEGSALVSSLQKDLQILEEKYRNKENDHVNKAKDYQDRLDNVVEQLEAAKKERDVLQKKLAATYARLRDASATTNNTIIPLNDAVKEIVATKTKNILWGMVKFVQNHEDEHQAALLLVKYAKIEKHHLNDEAVFINSYKRTVRKAIFQRRNYVAAEHKKVLVTRFKACRSSMPTLEQLLKCLRRDITTDEDKEIFEFYWDQLLPKQVGSLHWSREVRYYETICRAMRRDVPKLPLITSQDEAFTVLVIQNSLSRWTVELLENKKGKKRGGEFTSTQVGQNEWGGWSQEGLDLFHSYVEMNIEARKDGKTRAVEKACLQRLKVKNQISCKDHKSQMDFARRCKRKPGEVIAPKAKKSNHGGIRLEHVHVPREDEVPYHHHYDEDDDDDDGKCIPHCSHFHVLKGNSFSSCLLCVPPPCYHHRRHDTNTSGKLLNSYLYSLPFLPSSMYSPSSAKQQESSSWMFLFLYGSSSPIDVLSSSKFLM